MTAYEPKYLHMEDVPFSGPDRWDEPEWAKAIKWAEAIFEADINEGGEISDPGTVHTAAVSALATHIITVGPEEATDATLGDVEENAGDILEYSTQFLDTYRELRTSVIRAEQSESDPQRDRTIVTVGQ